MRVLQHLRVDAQLPRARRGRRGRVDEIRVTVGRVDAAEREHAAALAAAVGRLVPTRRQPRASVRTAERERAREYLASQSVASGRARRPTSAANGEPPLSPAVAAGPTPR